MLGQLLPDSITNYSMHPSYDKSMIAHHTDWLKNLTANLKDFLFTMERDDFSHIQYTYSGDLYNTRVDWGLANAVYATKILYISNLLETLSISQKDNLYQKLKCFFQDNGYIYDPLLTNLSFKDRVRNLIEGGNAGKSQYLEEVKRAETRQSFAALYLLGKQPHEPFLGIPYTKEGIAQYLSGLDWTLPWSAGSHFSHLLFFLRMNKELFDYKTDLSNDLIQYAVEWITSIQSKRDGTWYQGNDVSLVQKINGAMKVLTGLHAANLYHIDHAEALVDTALSGSNDAEACSNFNVAYVLYGGNKVAPTYRKDEIDVFLLDRIDIYHQFYHPDQGGFSFHRNQAGDTLYGKKIAIGKNEPDIHGTVMFVWGLAIINSIVDLGLGFKVPVN